MSRNYLILAKPTSHKLAFEMTIVGPELPPHLVAKRKRESDDQDSGTTHFGPSNRSPPSGSDNIEKRRRTIGPSLPPASLDERPSTALDGAEESDSDDDIGPALPSTDRHYDAEAEILRAEEAANNAAALKASSKPKREEWMLVPPKQDDWSTRIDPTKLKSRKFNTGKGAKGPPSKGGVDNALWTETPGEKLKRLGDEVMGVKKPAQLDQESKKSAKSEAEAREIERRIREYNVRVRPTFRSTVLLMIL